MVDVEAAQAAAQKLADQFAEQGDTGTNGSAEVKEEDSEALGNKRKLEDEDSEAARKKLSTGQGEKKFVQLTSGPSKAANGEFTDTIEVAKSMIGKLIGKSGETIRQLQNLTGTRIQIDHQLPGEFKKVVITGPSEDNITGCLREVERVMSDEPMAGETNKTLSCPPPIVGRIIGRGGETIRSLQQASQAHIIVDQNFPEGEDRKVILSGRPDAVERASKMIEELINGEPGNAQTIIQKYSAGINRTLDCPKSIVGRVIGKGGDTIKQMQRTFGANIQIDQQQDPMKITIAGPAQAVDAAASAIREIINGGNPYLGGPGGAAFGSQGGPGFGPGGPRGGGGGGGFPGGPGFGGPGGPGFGGGFPGGFGGFPGAFGPQAGFGGYPNAFPQPYGQPNFGFPGFGADPYTAAAGGAAGGGYGAGAAAASSAYATPQSSLWQEMSDDQGRTYYYNTQTGASQWEKPE